jgi:hypothetical protein
MTKNNGISSIVGNSKKIIKTEKVMRFLMEIDMKVILKMDVDMDKEDLLMKMETFMMVILSKVFQKEKDYN